MDFIPVPSTYQCNIHMVVDGQRIENTLYFRHAGAVSVTQMQQLGLDLIAWWTDEMAPNLSVAVVLNEVAVIDISDVAGPSIAVVATTGTAGTQSDETLPNNVSLCVSFRTAGRGRSARGRNYLPPPFATQVVTNTFTVGYVAAMHAAYNVIGFGGSFTDDMIWVVVSRFHNKLPRVTGITQNVLSVVIVDAIVDSQRRRLPTRGT
jgi:hypothetical protein